MAKISIIVPYLKGPAYLEDCIQSIEDQKMDDIEVILVDDKDGHDVPDAIMQKSFVKYVRMEDEKDVDEFYEKKDAFLEERRRKRLGMNKEEYAAYLLQKEQQKEEEEEADDANVENPVEGELELPLRPFGVAAARNTGVKYATGTYLYFLDADDYLLEDALPKLYRLAEEKQADMVTGNRYASWFRPISFDFEKAKADSEIEGIVPLEGETLEAVLSTRFTMQHFLIRRSYYDAQGVSFDEMITFYSDVPVIAKLLAGAKGKMWVDGSSIYVWRRRNDPIHLPALSQKKRKRRTDDYIESYEKAKEEIKDAEESLQFALNRRLCRFTISKFPNRLKGAKSVRYTKNLQKIPKDQLKKIKKELTFFHGIELGYIVKGKYRTAKPFERLAHVMQKKRGLFGKPIQYWRFLDKHIFQKMPVKENWVFVESFFGKSYSDSPKYLYEYLYDTYGDKYHYIWCLNKRAKEMKGHPPICKRHTLRYVYYLSRSKYIICNTRQPAWFKKREEVMFLETWHGTPLKKLAFDLDDIHAASQNHKTMFYRQGKAWNYLISANRFSTDVFERAFCVPREKIIEVGYPRNDILYSERADEIAKEVKKEFGIPEGKRVILYAPTWRDNQFYGKGKYKFTLAMDLERMRKEFGKDSVILLRTHYYIADSLDLTGLEDFVYNGSTYNDVSRLYLASDICITDYSSVFFDYANLRRPMLFFAYDYEDYKDEIRGMYFDMNTELPGPIVQTNDELVDALHHIDEISEKYKERYDRFYDKFCHVDDGHASKRAIDIVFEGAKPTFAETEE